MFDTRTMIGEESDVRNCLIGPPGVEKDGEDPQPGDEGEGRYHHHRGARLHHNYQYDRGCVTADRS